MTQNVSVYKAQSLQVPLGVRVDHFGNYCLKPNIPLGLVNPLKSAHCKGIYQFTLLRNIVKIEIT